MLAIRSCEVRPEEGLEPLTTMQSNPSKQILAIGWDFTRTIGECRQSELIKVTFGARSGFNLMGKSERESWIRGWAQCDLSCRIVMGPTRSSKKKWRRQEILAAWFEGPLRSDPLVAESEIHWICRNDPSEWSRRNGNLDLQPSVPIGRSPSHFRSSI